MLPYIVPVSCKHCLHSRHSVQRNSLLKPLYWVTASLIFMLHSHFNNYLIKSPLALFGNAFFLLITRGELKTLANCFRHFRKGIGESAIFPSNILAFGFTEIFVSVLSVNFHYCFHMSILTLPR